MSKEGINLVFAAAIVNEEFRKKLLKVEGSLTLLKKGYGGEIFDLTGEEITKLVTTEAETLAELAKKISGTEESG